MGSIVLIKSAQCETVVAVGNTWCCSCTSQVKKTALYAFSCYLVCEDSKLPLCFALSSVCLLHFKNSAPETPPKREQPPLRCATDDP